MNAARSKPELREQVDAARKALSPGDVAAFSERIATHVLALPVLERARHVAVYLARPHEVQTSPLIAALRQRGVALSIPVFDPARRAYDFAGVPADETLLTRGPLGILQPARPSWVLPAMIDAAIVPGVAFAPDGTRLGHGAGIYDRLLAECPGTRIGVAFACQRVAHLPSEPHDIPMHWVVTETGAHATTRLPEQKHETTTP